MTTPIWNCLVGCDKSLKPSGVVRPPLYAMLWYAALAVALLPYT